MPDKMENKTEQKPLLRRGVPIEWYLNKYGYGLPNGGKRITCPICGSSTGFSVDLKLNAFNCFGCGAHGSTYDLHSALKGMPKDTARKVLRKEYLNDPNGKVFNEKLEKAASEEKVIPADEVHRDYVYRELLKLLKLEDKHRNDLHRRGLTDKDIENLGYKTYSNDDIIALQVCKTGIGRKICMYAKNGNAENSHIPGFYDLETNEPHLVALKNNDSGYLIPVKDMKGNISGFQVRYDNGVKPKYGWLSSGSKSTGVGVDGNYCNNIQHSGDWKLARARYEGFPKTIGLTEGALKADIASLLFDKLNPNDDLHLFLGLTGITNQKRLPDELKELKELGLEEVHIFTDMDYITNKNVENAVKKLIQTIKTCGLKYVFKKWNDQYKGIDDYLLSEYKAAILAGKMKWE